MKLNTEILFLLLLKSLHPEIVCDVGSMDGTNARRFRQILPDSRIIAFEANPENIRSMQEDEDIKKDGIEIEPKAVSNRNGALIFNVEHLSTKGGGWRRAISSIHKRKLPGSIGVTGVEVESVRLDTFVQGLDVEPENVALWIDVEGAAFEALEGIGQIQDKVKIVHVEVETQQMWCGQKLEPDIKALMRQMDFIRLAEGFPPPFDTDGLQHDLVFIDSNTFRESPFKFKAILSSALTLTQAFGQRLYQEEFFQL